MSTERLSEADMLSNLPYETLFEIFSYLCPIGDGLALVCTSRMLRDKLIVQLYKEAGRQLNWLPLLFGITEGKTDVLDRCLEAGAPLDHRWPYIDDCRNNGDPEYSFTLCDALEWAELSRQEESQMWLNKRVVADRAKHPRWICIREARWLVFGVKTFRGKGGLRPVQYRREIHQTDGYSYEPYLRSPHLVWYGPEIEPCLVFPRLLDILKNHCELSLPFHVVDGCLAVWISRFWLDMLLSSTNPGPLLKSGFFESTVRDRTYHTYKGRDDMFGKASLIGNMLYYASGPEFARHFTPSFFRLLLDSEVDLSLITSAYISIFYNLVSNRRDAGDFVPSFRFYPLLLRALIDLGADTDTVERFRFGSLLPLLDHVGSSELQDALSKPLDDMANRGASPEERVFAFSPLAQTLVRCDRTSLSSMPLVEDLVTRLCD